MDISKGYKGKYMVLGKEVLMLGAFIIGTACGIILYCI